MRTTSMERTGTIRRTIDLTDASTRGSIMTPLQQRRRRDAEARRTAFAAFRATRRRRRVHAAIDALADGAIATGGLSIVNSAMNLNVGLPGGIAGIAIGLGLVALGAVIAMLHRARRDGGDPATAAMPARTIILDETAHSVVNLDETAHVATHTAA
ncbi:MAG: hypothetical protein ACREQ9_22555 [Candidatus Binatia bacterium]